MKLPLLLTTLLLVNTVHAQEVQYVIERAQGPGAVYQLYASGGVNIGQPAILTQGTEFTVAGFTGQPLFIGDRMTVTPVSVDAKGVWTMEVDATISNIDDAPTKSKLGYAYSQSRVHQRVVITPGGPAVNLDAGSVGGTIRISLKSANAGV